MIVPEGILMIEPFGARSATPVIDDLTRKMAAAWCRQRDSMERYGYMTKGFHRCVCDATSDNLEHWVGEGKGPLTNSLCIHYLAFHREDIPDEELAKVDALPYGSEDPTETELQ
jgi:hypothetical protein